MRDSAPLPTVLIFGDSAEEPQDMVRALGDGYEGLTADRRETALALMADHFVQVCVIVGAQATPANIETLSMKWPETMIVAIHDQAEALEDAHFCLPRHWTREFLLHTVRAAATSFRLARENSRMALEMRCLAAKQNRKPDVSHRGFETILHAPGSAMTRVISAARQFASFDVPVLLAGEAGTGKAGLARALHESSLRSDGPFRQLDPVGLSHDAVARALFGRRVRGQGSGTNITGLVRKANQGTLYLAHLEVLSRPMQARVLRLVQDGTFETEGDPEAGRSQIRLVASVGSDPEQLVSAGHLDPVLYFALSAAELSLPPLRQRQCDIAILAQAAVDTASASLAKRARGLSDEALRFLARYDWPGNLHELEKEITRMLILSQEPVLGAELISRQILQAMPHQDDRQKDKATMVGPGTLKARVEEIEARILRETLTRLNWNKSRSAIELGLSRVGLRAKLDRYGILPPQSQPQEA